MILDLQSGNRIEMVAKVDSFGYRLTLQTNKPGESNQYFSVSVTRDELLTLMQLLHDEYLRKV